MTAYKRKTTDLWLIEGNYGHGWETVTAEENRDEARARLREYRENEPGTAHRIRKTRERIAQ